jgi:hypothetical protein
VSKRATYNLMFNAVGALLVLTVIGYVAWSLFQFEREEPCRGRYPAPTRFSLTTAAGAPLSPIELQGRADCKAIHHFIGPRGSDWAIDAEVRR